MKMKTKVLVAALTAAGVIAPFANADTITPPATVPPQAQNPAVSNVYTVTYPVTVTLAGGSPQNVSFTYNSNGTWSAPAGWTYAGNLNQNANTAVFTTTSGGVQNGVALSSTGANQFVPAVGSPATTNPPSVGVNLNNNAVTGAVLSGFGAATATGTVTGVGQTTAPLNGAPATAQLIGVGSGGAPVGTVSVGTPISVNPSTATSPVGNAGGAVTVNSNQPNQSIGWGQYTATVPTTNTPAGTSTINGTIAGSSGSVGANGIFLNNITGTATYNTGTGVVQASPTQTATFSVLPNGNTAIGGTLSVAGATTTNGIANTGNITNSGNITTGSLNVNGPAVVNGSLQAGATSTAGLVNTGAMSTTTLTVSGATVTNGIQNFGNFANSGNAAVGGSLGVTGNTTLGGTLAVTGGATVGGALGVTGNTTLGGTLAVAGASTTSGISNTGNIANSGNLTNAGNASVGGTLTVTGASTLNGATTVNNTLTATGTTTLGSTAGTGGNTVVVSSSGITATAGTSSLALNSSGATMSGGGSSLALAGGKATFAGSGGSPVTVTGVANGVNQFDAVNWGQVSDIEKQLKRGIAATGAALNIPQVDQNKSFNLGVGVGGYDGETGWAIGGSARISKDGIIKASVAGAGGGGSKAVWGVGGGWSW